MNKSINLLSLLLLVLFLSVSCSSDETIKNDDNAEKTEFQKISNLKLNLNIKFETGKEYPIEKDELSNFISENYEEINKIEKGYALTFKKVKKQIVYSIDNLETLQSKLDGDPPGFWSDGGGLNCTKCRNQDCVVGALTAAAGDGSSQVFISMTPNYTLGVQTSLSVCYGSLADIIAEFEP
ncbi:hypothetical protein BFP78_15350 [Gaetbulibacter sp. 5U11]|nr:hypothetical protein BFP78_15350 [Gaetbulibacter sp. 5U11]